MQEELNSLEQNGVCNVVRLPKNSHSLHSKWLYITKRDPNSDFERYKARLVVCGNEQVFCRDYNFTFAAVMDMSSVKFILALSQK